ncbi:Male sterility protein [Aspergillus sp. HF37]|nr:Male sterility protein [Aspergillus sp. HF37]
MGEAKNEIESPKYEAEYGEGEVHDDTKLLSKIDWQVLPTMFMTYFLQFVDKISLNYANVMGLRDDLGMSGNDFSWLATAFFIAYAVAEFPQGVLLQRFPVTKVLGVNVFFWGVFLCCSAATQSYTGMMALRILLGMVEAVIAPALTMYTSMWYTRAESTPRYGLWYCGLGAGQIVGGLISFGAQHAPESLAFNGWRIMFVAVGAVNVLVSLLVLFLLPETPEKARFLTPPERQRIATRLAEDQAGVGEKVFRWRLLLEAFGDLQTWLLVLLTILITIPSGVITTFSSILIKDFGYTSKQSALLNMPSGVVSIMATMGSTYATAKGISRWLAIDLLLIPTLLGSCLMSFLPHSNQPGLLAGIYLVNTTVAPLALIFAWTGANFKGYTMKVSGCTLVSAGFSIANIIGPQTFQAEDAPRYIPAKITLVAVNAASVVIATLLRVVYGMRNARANRSGAPARSMIEERMAGDADVQDVHDDKDFRYVY